MLPLPIDPHLPGLLAGLQARHAVVVGAPPGSGKSTRVPPALLDALPGQVLLLQPRRVAARALARRIAEERGWSAGQEVGWQVRFEKVGSAATRLWVMTEGTLTRRLAGDPYLEGVSAVVLDEFHERNLHSDLALAYLRELQRTVREDLALVVMSATLDAEPICAFLGGCPRLDAPGRCFPVELGHRHLSPRERLDEQVAAAVEEAIGHPDCGDLLVFLPGAGEIAACRRLLEGRLPGHDVLPLHGSLPPDEQDRALRPGPRPRVVLATNVAETSLTIPGIRTVIDTGTARVNRFNPATGLDELRLEAVSRASCAQRAGRAGRTAPGRCWRLGSHLADAQRPEAGDPEVRRVDLAGPLLALRRLGYHDARRFPWFEAPEAERLAAAEELLAALGAVQAPFGPATERGRRMAELPAHPRLARLLLDAEACGAGRLAAGLAAVSGERDLRLPAQRGAPPPTPGPADALLRLDLLEEAERGRFDPGLRQRGIDPGAAREAARVRDDLLRLLRRAGPPAGEAPSAARLLLAAYPDRVVKRAAPDANRGLMAGGVAVELEEASAVAARRGHPRGELFLAVVCQGLGQGLKAAVKVRQAAELAEEDLEAVFPGSLRREERLWWDEARGVVEAQVGWWYRDLAVRMARGAQADPERVAALLAEKLAPEAEALVLADEAAGSFLQRLRWLRQACPELDLPAIGAPELAELVAGLCQGRRSRAEVAAAEKLPWLSGRFEHRVLRQIEDWAPSHLTVPTGSRIRLDYANADAEHPPVLAVRLQELFGTPATPHLAGGRIPVLLHLLGPNYRCEQVTRDLASFWQNTYPQVRKDLRGRYPKHAWPEDPLAAAPVCKGRPSR